MKCRLLMMVLIGNLDLAIDDDPLVNQTARYITISATSQTLNPWPAATNAVAKSISDGGEAPTPSGSARRTPDPHNDNGSIPMMRLNDGDENVGEINQVRIGKSNRTRSSSDMSERRLSSSRAPQIRIDDASLEPGVIQRRDTSNLKASPWRHMEELLYPIRLYDDERSDRQLSPRQYPVQSHSLDCLSHGHCDNREHIVTEKPHPRNSKIDRQISKT